MAVEKAHLPNLAVVGSHFSTVGSNLAQALSTIKSSMGGGGGGIGGGGCYVHWAGTGFTLHLLSIMRPAI